MSFKQVRAQVSWELKAFRNSLLVILAFVWRWTFRLVVTLAVVLLIANVFWFAPRDVSYRHRNPLQAACNNKDGTQKSTDALTYAVADDSKERDNDELVAISRDEEGKLREYLTCMLQRHTIPRADGKDNLAYNLAFVEFTETGLPVEASDERKSLEGSTQLQSLLNHLRAVEKRKKTNFVVSFIHGWRHDAHVGDDDVRKLRLFAAYTAAFLAQRCEVHGLYCNHEVTAVYFGWRGARLREDKLQQWLSGYLGSAGWFLGVVPDKIFGELPALLTLFDRKPVSERIAPAMMSALRQIDRVVYARDTGPWMWRRRLESRMITIGHSLGGNALASGLHDDFVQRVHRHQHNATMAPPFGDLIVLLNPAAEAWKWTGIQRVVRARTMFDHPSRPALPLLEDGELRRLPADLRRYKVAETYEAMLNAGINDQLDIDKGHWLFPPTQRPIYVALTAANTWPVGGIRRRDCEVLKKEQKRLTNVKPFPDYDYATHDAFPAFKMDFRPLAETFENWAYYRSAQTPFQRYCERSPNFLSYPLLGIASFLRNFPFMDTDVEQTRTIGHINPMRSFTGDSFTASSLSANNVRTATFFGTTHEFTITDLSAQQPDPGGGDLSFTAVYRAAGDFTRSGCARARGWLTEARKPLRGSQNSRNAWTYPVQLQTFSKKRGQVPMEGLFRHGYVASGMLPVVRPNDPFWNVRVFDTGMQGHGSYDSFPLICTITQLVIDDIVEE